MPEPQVHQTELAGVLVIDPDPIRDDRGFFVRTMDSGVLLAAGVKSTAFVQENQSRSGHRVLRGLHFRRQLREAKLIRCAHGRVFEAVVDLRPGSPTFLSSQTFILDDEAHRQIYVPPGCAHGFQVLSADADICYKHDAVYAPELEGEIAWDDPELAIPWPIPDPILSPRDLGAPRLQDIRDNLVEWFGAPEPSTAFAGEA